MYAGKYSAVRRFECFEMKDNAHMSRFISSALTALLALAPLAEARIIRLEIEKRESPAYEAKSFGKAGQYEILTGHFYGVLNPKAPENATINDIGLAVRNAQGLVEYSGTFAMAKPIDMKKASSVLLYGVPNRGRGGPEARDGHVSVVSGWQGDVNPAANLQTISVPVARNGDGSSLTGPVTTRFINALPGANTLSLSAGTSSLSYQRPATLDTGKATLTRRAAESAPATAIPAAEWAFADCSKTAFPGTPDPSKICLKAGLEPTALYELSFTAKDPLVMGIGYAATRDLNSFLRYAEKDDSGTPNPVAGQIRYGIAEGNSQSGNFLRSYIHLGFNRDENGKIVWDGINPHIATRQLAMNFRFAVAGGTAMPNEPGSEAPVWWGDYTDDARGRPKSSVLDRCKASNTCPKIVETFGSLEFWDLRASLDLVGTDAKADIALPANVRRYYFPATTHGGGRGGFNIEAPQPPSGCVLPANPNPESDQVRALRAALVDWVTRGIEPPASRYPMLSRSQLVAPNAKAMGYPLIPGFPTPDGVINPAFEYDFGSEFRYSDMAGAVSLAPPSVRKILPSLVPAVNADGNETSGVASVLLQAPLGTYVGWNVTAAGFNKGKVCGLNGGYIPFAKTKADRQATGDPRLSIEERYVSHDAYVAAVKAAATKAVSERFLLPEDADKLVAQAAASSVLTGQPAATKQAAR
jgi:hypothetical protein